MQSLVPQTMEAAASQEVRVCGGGRKGGRLSEKVVEGQHCDTAGKATTCTRTHTSQSWGAWAELLAHAAL